MTGRDHHWGSEDVTDRGLLREAHCIDPGCFAVRIRVGSTGSLSCSWHGEQMSSPCYSCESVPWRRGMIWADRPDLKVVRCESTDRNGFGDVLRCCLIASHRIGHQSTCPSFGPGGRWQCWLPYGHRGDNHINRDGTTAWVDAWIGPTSRKPESAWKVLT